MFIIWREEAFDIGTINAARFIRGLSIKPGFERRDDETEHGLTLTQAGTRAW